jgi:MYXO-CTERM domain-containing protein
MTAGPLAGQCVLGDAGLLDAGQDSETSEAGSDSESDATSGGADGGADATPDVDESGADAPGASHGNSGDAGEQDGGAVASPPPDGGADSGLGATADVDVSADSAAEDSTVTSDGAAADARSSDAAISSDNNDGNASLARDAGDAGVPADSRGETADTSSEPTQLPTFEGGGGCACRAAPKPASHQALVLPFLGLALWIRRRRASKAHSSLSSCDATVGGTTMWRLTSKSNATKGPDRARAHILSIRSILKGQEPRHQVGDDDPTQAATPRAKRASEGRVKARFDDADDFPFWWVV